MAVIDQDLVRAINSGRCYAIVGSGPSCEEGVPSWSALAKNALDSLDPAAHGETIRVATDRLRTEDYPGVFGAIEGALGIEGIVSLVRKSLAVPTRKGKIYEYLARWPFMSYLTTNFDDRLEHHLAGKGPIFVSKTNSPQDMRLLRADSSGLVVHLHGTLDDAASLVLSSSHYGAFRDSPDRRYWRDKLFSLFNTVNIVIVGYSARDPDFRDMLERAKVIADPARPIFMFASDLDVSTIRELYERFNIRIISYRNRDGTHFELLRKLKIYDAFVAKRQSQWVGLPAVDQEEARLAASLHLFTRLRLTDTSPPCLESTYRCVLLQVLGASDHPVQVGDLGELLRERLKAARGVDPVVLNRALELLNDSGLVKYTAVRHEVEITEKGKEVISSLIQERALILTKFEAWCKGFLSDQYQLQGEDAVTVTSALIKGIVLAFGRRGIEIARSVFVDDPIDFTDATDLLETINNAAAEVSEQLRPAFADLLLQIIVHPSTEAKEYLASLSQGYFAYHALGFDPNCSNERLRHLQEHPWISDSSIAIPLLAVGCVNHNYAVDLFAKMRAVEIKPTITDRLCEEVETHLTWALENFGTHSSDSVPLLHAAISAPGYRQNLFVNGYVSWATTAGNPSFAAYVEEIFGDDYQTNVHAMVEAALRKRNFEIVDIAELPGFDPTLWATRDELAKRIEDVRREAGTFRSFAQCVAEAEVVIAHQMNGAFFLSQSVVIERAAGDGHRIVWKPEALYRALAMFSTETTAEDLLYQSMVQDFYYSGLEIVDATKIRQYAAPQIKQAQMKLHEERKRYVEALGEQRFMEMQSAFDRTPDEEKPFYSLQFAFYMEKKENERRRAAEREAESLRGKKDLTEKERQELERFRSKKKEKSTRQKRKRKSQKKKGRKK